MKKLQLFCVAAVLTAVFSLPALAVLYYGNYATVAGTNSFAGKVFISDGQKMKTITGQYQMIARGDKKVSWVLLPDQNTYTVSPISLNSSSIVSMKIIGEIGRKKIGSELVNTIECEKYLVTCKVGKKNVSMYQWTSSDYPFPLKAATIDGTWSIELSQLQVITNHTDSLFEIPAGFRKVAN